MTTFVGTVTKLCDSCGCLKPCCGAKVLLFNGQPTVSYDSLKIDPTHQVGEGITNNLGKYAVEGVAENAYIASRCSDDCQWILEPAVAAGAPTTKTAAYVNLVGPAETEEGQAGNYTISLVDNTGAPLVADEDIIVTLVSSGSTDPNDTDVPVPTTITIPSGQSSVALTQVFLADTDLDPDELHSIRIAGLAPNETATLLPTIGPDNVVQTIVREALVKTCITTNKNGTLDLTIDVTPGTQPPIWVDETGVTSSGTNFSKTYSDGDEKTVCVWTSPAALLAINGASMDITDIVIPTENETSLTRLNAPSNAAYAPDTSYLVTLTSLTYLNLYNTGVTGSVEPLAALSSLTYLNLYNTGVTGSVEQLAALTALTYLHLGTTTVTGSVEPLAALTALTYLHLGTTTVTGSVEPLAALTALAYLHLYNTGVTGSLEPLAALSSLAYLNLFNTGVTGSVEPLAALTALTYLKLYNTGVTGSVEPLAALTALTYLHLYNTGVNGNIDTLLPIAPPLDRLNVESTSVTGTAATWLAKGLADFNYTNSGVV